MVYSPLFKDSKNYRKVVEALSEKKKGLSREKIKVPTHIKEDGTLTEILSNLAQCDFIREYDEVINICEIKFSSDEYAITDAYEETLRKRASLFKKVTKTKKALQHTFITTYGLKQNKYSGMIQSEVTMDDLFQL